MGHKFELVMDKSFGPSNFLWPKYSTEMPCLASRIMLAALE